MPPGKAAAQASHAARLSLLRAIRKNPELAEASLSRNSCGSAIALLGPKLRHLQETYEAAQELGLPCALFTDSGHILPPHFDGSPTITALAVGPCSRAETAPLFRRFRCL